MKKSIVSTWPANLFYLAVLWGCISMWPYTVYHRIGQPMPLDTPREKFIVAKVYEYSKRRGQALQVTFRVGEVPSSAGALTGASVIIVSPAMLDPQKFSDPDVEFILAHEVGHLERHDAYRFWTTWRRTWAEARESAADVIGVSLVGCQAMAEAIRNHREAFMIGYLDHSDPHPHPQRRYDFACIQKK